MRRKLYSLTAGLAAALLLGAACSSDDTAEKPVPEPATLTAPALTLSADAVLIDPEHSDQPALHAEWTAATDDEQTEVAYMRKTRTRSSTPSCRRSKTAQ